MLEARLAGAAVALAVREGESFVVTGAQGIAPSSPAARVIETGRPVFITDTGLGPRPHRALVVPLLARGETIGVLALQRAGELGRGERAAVERLGAYVGLALENARLLSRQRRFTQELEDQVSAATRRLEALDRAKSTFVATVSHELRTPLTPLLGFGELLATRTYPTAEVQRLAGIICRETERLARIVDDLLDLSRMERGQGPRIVPTAVAVGPAISGTLALFRRGRVTHDLVVAVEDGLPDIQADPDALDRILKNLVANAIKYSPSGSRVTVSARAGAGGVEIAVADEGRGIPAAALPQDLRALLSRAGRGRHGPRRRPRAGRGQGARRGPRRDHSRRERHRTGHARRVHTAQFLTLCVAPVYPTWAMPRRDGIAERMADAVLKRLVTRKIIDVKDEKSARAALRQVVLENLAAEEQIEVDARKLLLDHAKAIKDSAADYRALFGKVKEKLARERGFIL